MSTRDSGGMPPRTDWFERWALYAPDAQAITDEESGRSFTYARATDVINRLARVLREEYAVRTGERIAVL
ncbi:MAG: acid--CoA ligase, partial [Bacteroidetes bacterium]|nr:acid--CoA ligase [Bacteroidota bacterium]